MKTEAYSQNNHYNIRRGWSIKAQYKYTKLYTTNLNNPSKNEKFIIKHNSMKISNLNGFSFDLS